MKNLNDYVDKLETEYGCTKLKITSYLVDNNWFGITPKIQHKKIYLSDEDYDYVIQKLTAFAKRANFDDAQRRTYLHELLENKYPETTSALVEYFVENEHTDTEACEVLAFLSYHLDDELTVLTHAEVHALLEKAHDELYKCYADIIADFVTGCVTIETQTIGHTLKLGNITRKTSMHMAKMSTSASYITFSTQK